MNGTHIGAPAEPVHTMVQRRVATKTMGNGGTFAVCALTADNLDKCLRYDTSTNMAAAGGPMKRAQPMGARGRVTSPEASSRGTPPQSARAGVDAHRSAHRKGSITRGSVNIILRVCFPPAKDG